jgi:uncharacterized protein
MQFRAIARAVAAGILFGVTAVAATAETPIPPAPSAWITDTAALIAPQTVSDVDARLRAYQKTSGHQILVYIAPSTGGATLEDWTVRAFARWKVGRKGLDDGLVLFLFAKDRTVRIEVGYGLEGTVPDALASRIVRETIEPQMRAGRPDQAVTLGVDRILRLSGGEVPQASASPANAADSGSVDAGNAVPLSPIELVFIGLLIVGLIIVAIRSPMTALFLLVNIFGGRGGDMGGGGGGFSGGGGRSGGGGASGRW